jgi:hypothetical protein
LNLRLVTILVVVTFFSCQEKKAVPDTLKIAFEYLDKNWDPQQKISFINLQEKEFTPVFYDIDIEDEIQQKLLKNHKDSEKFQAFFDSLGIDRQIDRSGLILNTYYNFINTTNIGLKDEVHLIKNYWQPIEECTYRLKTKAITTYKKHSINDILEIKLPLDENNNAIDFNCPSIDWNYREGKDLKIKSLLIEKHISTDSTNAIFKLKLIGKNKTHIEILHNEIYEGDLFSISLYNCWKINTVNNRDETEPIDI